MLIFLSHSLIYILRSPQHTDKSILHKYIFGYKILLSQDTSALV